MMCPSTRCFIIVTALALVIPGEIAQAASPEKAFHEAYYLEHEKGDVQAAAKLYQEVIRARKVDPDLKNRAMQHLSSCREEIACADLAALMPAEAMLYLQVNSPAVHLQKLLDSLGLTETATPSTVPIKGKHVAISPELIKELFGLRGFAVAITGFNPENEIPSGVAVLHPGNINLLRALLDSALPTVAEAVDPIEGHSAYLIEGKVYACLMSRMVVLSTDLSQIQAVLTRINGNQGDSFAARQDLAEVTKYRHDSLMFCCLDAKKFLPIAAQMAARDPGFAQARVLLDLDHLKWAAGWMGVNNDGVSLDFAACMDEGQHNIAYNLFRTPPITHDTLQNIPKGAAGFLAGALSKTEERSQIVDHPSTTAAEPVTGLDIGREIFANMIDFVIYAMPPADHTAPQGPSMPDLTAAIRVRDPDKSEALWTQILGIISLAAGSPTIEDRVENISGADAELYKFPNGMTIYFARVDDNIYISTTRPAMQSAIATAKGGESILQDKAFAASIKILGQDTSKALILHIGRCLQVAKPFMSSSERKEAESYAPLLDDMTASLVTHETVQNMHLSVSISGLPDIGQFVAQAIQQEEHQNKMKRELRTAMRSSNWTRALEITNQLISDKPDQLSHYVSKFRILAVGIQDQEAASTWAETILDKAAHSANTLNNLAWALLIEDDYRHLYNDQALRMAKKACELTKYHNWAYLDTLALAEFETGDAGKAIELQQKAIDAYGRNDNDGLNKALVRYRAERD